MHEMKFANLSQQFRANDVHGGVDLHCKEIWARDSHSRHILRSVLIDLPFTNTHLYKTHCKMEDDGKVNIPLGDGCL